MLICNEATNRFAILWVVAACGIAAHAAGAPADSAGHNLSVTRKPTIGSPRPVSFLNDVEPILTRAGCNQGSCHGSQFGKGGFKLSLAAYDPDMDYDSIVRAGKGRRISALAPSASLLLRKPSLDLAHLGGLALTAGSPDYKTMVRWLEQGAPGPNPRDPHTIALIAAPPRAVLRPGQAVQLTVRARYSDGTVRDVTGHTRISTLNDTIATVSPDGRVVARGRGETAVMLRFDGLATVSRVAVPYTAQPPESAGARGPASAGASTFVDSAISRRWRDLGLQPSGRCTDAEFIRRASLDIVGTLPSGDEVRAFVNDHASEKDARLIDRLLQRPEYADFWTLKWCDLLRVSRASLGEKAMWSFRNWIHESFAHNRPYDAFVHDLVTAQGGAFAEPAANYYRVAASPQELAEGSAQVFLGVRLQCARCHHHPFEKWSQTDYYQFAAFFARVGVKESREPGSAGPEPAVRVLPDGEVTHPKTGLPVIPTPLALQAEPRGASSPVDPDASGDRRLVLADWLTSPNNRTFAIMLVNRYWGYFLGRGIVQPVDDMRVTNPPSNSELLDGLADLFIENRFDLKRLIRVICTSRAYRLSSRSTPGNREDEVFYTHFTVRRQPAEVLLDSVDIASGTSEKFPGLPLGARAIQLPDAAVASPFLDTFGRPSRTTSCECERGMEASLSQALQMLNGELVNRKVTDPAGRVARLFAKPMSDPEIVEALYYAALSRPPRPGERAVALRSLAASVSRRQAAEDLLWALINTSEFAAIR